MSNFVEKIKVSGDTYILTGIWEGKEVWYRMHLRHFKVSMLGSTIGRNNIKDLEWYGEIIDSGWGKPLY